MEQGNGIARPTEQDAAPLLAELCGRAHRILARYYARGDSAFAGLRHVLDFTPYIVAPRGDLGRGGAVLLEEDPAEETVFLGICFGSALVDEVRVGKGYDVAWPGLHAVAVVAEETSHFLTLSEAAARGVGVSHLELETLGEIDRFLALLHWAASDPATPSAAAAEDPNLPSDALPRVSLPELCDAVFTGERFERSARTPLYVEAEARAFAHLKRAFARVWDHRAFDPRVVDAQAARYLIEVREDVLRARGQRRVAS